MKGICGDDAESFSIQILEEVLRMQVGQDIRQFLREPYATMVPVLNEKARRFWAGATAARLGNGGITAVATSPAWPRIRYGPAFGMCRIGRSPPRRGFAVPEPVASP